MLMVVFELVLSYCQFVAVVIEPKSNDRDSYPPKEWGQSSYLLSSLNLGFEVVTTVLTSLQDIRVYFMMQAVVLPLALLVFSLLFLTERLIVLWYLSTLGSFIMMVCGLLLRFFLPEDIDGIGSLETDIILYTGIGIFSLCIIILVALYLKRNGTVVLNLKIEMQKKTQGSSVWRSLRGFLLFTILAGVGIYLLLLKPFDKTIGNGFSFGLSVACLFVSFLLLIWTIVALFKIGRKAQWHVTFFFQKVFLRILLVLMPSLYIPIGTTLFMLFNCSTETCPNGYRLHDEGTILIEGRSNPCYKADIALDQACPADFAKTLGAQESSPRMKSNYIATCDGVFYFFWPAAILVIGTYLIGVPVLFFFLIRTSTVHLREEFPIFPLVPEDDEQDEDIIRRDWSIRVKETKNVAKFLFGPYRLPTRYLSLVFLMQKLVVVGSSVYIFDAHDNSSSRKIVIICSFVVHLMITALIAFLRPFILPVHNWIGLFLCSMLTVVCIFAWVQLSYTLPVALLIIVIVATYVVPFFVIVFSFFYHYKYHCNNTEEAVAAPPAGSPVTGSPPLSRFPGHARGNPAYINEGNLIVEYNEEENDASEYETVNNKVDTTSNDNQIARCEEDLEANILKEFQADVDAFIDNEVLGLARRFLMIGGFLFFIALGLSILGLWSRSTKRVHVASFSGGQPTIANQLGGYDNWTHFTESCCCIPTANPPPNYDVPLFLQIVNNYDSGGVPLQVEKWICENDNVVERVRTIEHKMPPSGNTNGLSPSPTSKGYVISSGLHLRPLCGVLFRTGCAPRYGEFASLDLDCVGGQSQSPKTFKEILLW